MHVIKSSRAFDEQLVRRGQDQAQVVDGAVLCCDPSLALPDGHRILGSAPFVLIQVVITGQGLNGAIGIEQGVAAVYRVIGERIGHGVSQSTRPGRINPVVDAPAQARRQHHLEPVCGRVIAVHPSTDPFVTVANQIAAVVIITDTGVNAVLFSATPGPKTVVVLDAHAHGFGHPVGFGEHGLLESVFSRLWRVSDRGEARQPDVSGSTIVFPGFLTKGQILLGVEHVGQGGWGGEAHARTELKGGSR